MTRRQRTKYLFKSIRRNSSADPGETRHATFGALQPEAGKFIPTSGMLIPEPEPVHEHAVIAAR
ncbi:hypothetical protein [Enterobacillus tribolii]|uniref:hypothetical protein n=1 Tax=Enterobacillus tribolii TaxID=1487935 RepID=UPI000E1C8464|nr:hypothetical protein [Enterobacillus tribolii]MBW7981762.1 hypothetical protein [Enterobacillus tribolii]